MAATETGNWVQHSTNPASATLSSITNPNATVSGLNTVGIYRFTWSSLGCADTMQITLNNTSTSSQSKSICQGQSFNGHNTAGVYIDTFQNKVGCDSIVTLNLAILNNSTSTIARTICQGESFLGRSMSGTFVDKFVSANGCDSLRTLVLNVNPIHNPIINKSICEGSLLWVRRQRALTPLIIKIVLAVIVQ